ncbi:MAG: PAS domain S-box protein, partial [Desulfobacterales bacterium]|nr:PAS domain S-box protein [Desulfobacterales bacterium]
ANLYGRDETERRKKDLQLKVSENWLSTTLRSIGDALIATDGFGNIRFINPIAEDLTGFTQEESIGKPLEAIFNIINEETHESVENPATRVIREGIIIGLANHTVLIAKDGKEIPIADSGAPIKDDKGNVIGVVLIFRDITESRKAEKEIANLARFPSENPNPVLRVSKESVIYTNKAGKSIFSIKEGDALPELFQDAVNEALNLNTPQIIEIELNNRSYTLDISPIKKEGYANLYGRDETERRKKDLQLKVSEKKYYEAYNRAEFYKDLFTHDINNILQNLLTAIQLSEELLGDPEKLEKIKRYNSIIKDQIKRGVKLVSNIRKLSKLENEEIGIEEIEILGILEKSITNVEIAYQDRNIDIKVDSIGKKLYGQVNELLEDLFENILINAIKYNKNPTVEILVKISKEKITSINYLKIEFIDNGIGIDDSRKKVVFQREASETTSTKGMGIGLSLVKK